MSEATKHRHANRISDIIGENLVHSMNIDPGDTIKQMRENFDKALCGIVFKIAKYCYDNNLDIRELK